MSCQEYDIMNNYLNDIFSYLMKEEYFLYINFEKMCDISDRYYMFFKDYLFNCDEAHNHLTYNDVYLLGRDIISSIDSKYLSDYDNLINSGILDFGFNNEYGDSAFVYCENDGSNHCEINIKRELNYSDVVSLIHECFHYTNGKDDVTKNRDYLTEFISIYFETYAIDYLMKMGINIEEICYEKRLFTTFIRTKYFYCMEMPLICFYKFGSVSDDSYNMYNDYCFPVLKKNYDKECQFLLDEFKKCGAFNKRLGAFVYLSNCKYLLGTILAFYARSYCSLEDILYLNEHVNIKELNLSKLLSKIGIKLNDDFFSKSFECIYKYLSIDKKRSIL